MPVLLIETSTDRSIVGIVEGKDVLFEKALPPGLQNSKYLAPAVAEGLSQLNIPLEKFSYIAVGIGPGSYTGIRVGVILATSLAFAAEIPVVGIPTLECFAPKGEGPFVVLIDAKVSGVYNAAGANNQGRIVYFGKSQVTPLDELDPLLKEATCIITPQAAPLKVKLSSTYQQAAWQESAPDLLQMANVAEQQRKRDVEKNEAPFELLYLRKTQAEIEKQLKELL